MDNLTIIIPFRNGHAYIEETLSGIPSSIPVIIIDDLSDVPLQLHNVTRNTERGYFTGSVNNGINMCNTDVLILNQDVKLTGNEWLNILSKNRKEYAMIGEGIKGVHPAYPNGYIHGTFMFIRRDAWEAVGEMNAKDYPLWGSTCEWQLRAARKGYKILPLKSVPGFSHSRDGNYGSSITQTLQQEPDKKGLFIKTPPAISVIVSTYNYGRYLPDLIASLIGGKSSLGEQPGQTFQSFEVIIVNDASTDNTQDYINRVVDSWKGIRAITLPPASDGRSNGTPVANNAGIAIANGQYISIIGGDDMMESWRLEEMYRLALSNPHSFVYDDMYTFTGGKRTKDWKMPDFNFELLLEKNHVHAGILFPKTAWEETGGYHPAMRYGREDWQFNIALGLKGYCGIHLNKPGYLYRREKQGRSLRNTSVDWHNRFINQLMGIYPNVYEGERPMGCCGNGKAKTIKFSSGGNKMATTNLLAGREGMTLLQYTGKASSDMTWYGPSGQRYKAGGITRIFRVDNKDVQFFLQQDAPDTFRLYKPVTQLKETAEVKAVNDYPVITPAQVIEQPVTVVASGTEVFPPIEPEQATTEEISSYSREQFEKLLSGSLGNVTPELESFNVAELRLLKEVEEAGKNRVTLIRDIDALIENYG